MAVYLGEQEFWKCPKHPSKKRRNGVCPTCLRDRLSILCPDCANIRPCGCCTTATSSSESSSSSSFSLFSTRSTAPDDSCRVGNLIESEPKFQRSRSVAFPFLRSRFSTSARDEPRVSSSMLQNEKTNTLDLSDKVKTKTRSFWSVFKSNKSRKVETEDGTEEEENCYYDIKIGEFERMMMKSRSMRVPSSLENNVKSSLKGKLWYFPSPINVFRQRSKVVQHRSPLQR